MKSLFGSQRTRELSTDLSKDKTSKALVLCSSGLDSVYNLLMSKKEFKGLSVLFFDYGQKAAPQEYIRVKKLCSKLDLELIRVDLPWYRELGSSLLDHSTRVTKYTSTAEADRDVKVNEWVPNRNGVFVNIAGAIAESGGFGAIVIGINKEEASRYPDNSAEFLELCDKLLGVSTLKHPRLHSFSSLLDKKDILRELQPLMRESSISPELIWSCYESFEKMCGSCESCVRLKDAVHKNGMESEWKGLFLK